MGRSRLESFAWLRRRIGLDIPVKDVLLTDFVNYPEEHVVRQARVMSPAMFIDVVGAIRRHQRARSFEARLVLFWALACVRQKHLEISTFTEESEQFVIGRCPEGKARRKGIRPPFAWAVPRPDFLPDAFSFLTDLAESLG